MPTWLSIPLFIAGVFLLAFLLSGALPRYRRARKRGERAVEFLANYHAYLLGESRREGWLIARSYEMQRDAESVGLGVTYIAPPPMIGGGYLPHQMFADLFNHQAYTDSVTAQYRIEVLTTTIHELQASANKRRGDLINPFAWLRLTFEAIVGFPRYLLRIAGFSERVTESSGARAITVLWSLLVGIAGIGSFVVAVIALAHGG